MFGACCLVPITALRSIERIPVVHVTDREQFLVPNVHPEMIPDSVLEIGYSLLDKVQSADSFTVLAGGLLPSCEKGVIPDFVIRRAIRALLQQRLREIDCGSFEANHAAKMEWIEGVRARDTIAVVTEKANEQHYEVGAYNSTELALFSWSKVSTEFILSCLGPYAKYSSCLYPTGNETLAEAETLMLESYCEKAQLKDGMDILDLGCGESVIALSTNIVSSCELHRLGESLLVSREGNSERAQC